MKNRIYIDLLDAISWNSEPLLTKALRNKHLDLADYSFFNLAVEGGNVKIVSMLIDYFFDNPPARYSHNTSIQIKNALQTQLRDILEIAIQDVALSKEMKKLLSKYTYIDIESEDEQDNEEDSSINERDTPTETESEDEHDLSAFDTVEDNFNLDNAENTLGVVGDLLHQSDY